MNEWVWNIGGMILTGENWSTGRETLYSVGGRWMNGYGALVEWYWQGKTEVLGGKPVTVPLYPPHRLTWARTRALGWEAGDWQPEPGQIPAFVSDRAFRDGVTHWISVVCMYVCVTPVHIGTISWYSVYLAFRRISVLFNHQMHKLFDTTYFL